MGSSSISLTSRFGSFCFAVSSSTWICWFWTNSEGVSYNWGFTYSLSYFNSSITFVSSTVSWTGIETCCGASICSRCYNYDYVWESWFWGIYWKVYCFCYSTLNPGGVRDIYFLGEVLAVSIWWEGSKGRWSRLSCVFCRLNFNV